MGRLASVTLAKEEDLGVNDVQREERSHIGYLLKAGDVCLGYDLTETQFVDDEAEDMRSEGKMPDIIVVRKLYGGVATGDVNASKSRIWKLQRLDFDVAESMRARSAKKEAEMDDIDEEDFMREVEADSEMRRNMNLYKSKSLNEGKTETYDSEANQRELDDEDDDDDQQVKLDELLDGLVLEDGPDPDDMIEKDNEMMGDDEAWLASALLAEGEKAAKEGISYIDRDNARQVKEKDSAVPVENNVFGKQYNLDAQFK